MVLNPLVMREQLFKQKTTQTDFGKRFNISRSVVSKACTGKSINNGSAKRIAQALNVPLENLKMTSEAN